MRRGFSLIELSVVLVIISLVMGMGLSAGTAYIDRTKADVTRERLKAIRAAIEAHVAANGSFPCPAPLTLVPGTAQFGMAQDCTTAAAGLIRLPSAATDTARAGAVPIRTLNLPETHIRDAWDGKFTYIVTKALTADLGADGVLSIQDGAGNPITTPPGQGAYMVVSHGRNRAGAYPYRSTAVAVPCGSALDAENCDTNDLVLLDAPYNDADTATSAYFDDHTVWGMKPAAAAPAGGTGAGLVWRGYTSDAVKGDLYVFGKTYGWGIAKGDVLCRQQYAGARMMLYDDLMALIRSDGYPATQSVWLPRATYLFSHIGTGAVYQVTKDNGFRAAVTDYGGEAECVQWGSGASTGFGPATSETAGRPYELKLFRCDTQRYVGCVEGP